MGTKIEWAEEVWNPVTGCTKVSEGCRNCYAEGRCRRFWRRWRREPPPDHFEVMLHPDRLEQPLHWRRPRRVFVCSMGDIFHEEVPEKFIDEVISMMQICSEHTFIVLTKRPDRMRDYVTDLCSMSWQPPPNVWLGVSVEDQAAADARIPLLLQTPAALRFVSCEPLLGPLEIDLGAQRLGWIIVGGESGYWARPMHPEWVRGLRDQAVEAKVPLFVKQLHVDGAVSHEPACWPEDLRIREYPEES